MVHHSGSADLVPDSFFANPPQTARRVLKVKFMFTLDTLDTVTVLHLDPGRFLNRQSQRISPTFLFGSQTKK